MSKDNPREYGTGAVYQRKSDGRWFGSYDDGFHASGARKRPTVSAKTEAAVKRKLRDKIAARDRGEVAVTRTTVKAWADTYLKMRVRNLSPKGYNAAANPIRNWVVPTIGHRRLDALTPGDVRAVHDACRAAGRQAGDVHRVLHTMLNAAVAEGHTVAPRVLKVKAPAPEKSDRAAMAVDEGLACLKVASEIPHGTRWIFTLLYGARLGECLGLTWDAVDLEAGVAGEAVIEWQLQALPYKHGCNGNEPPTCGKKQARSCPSKEFRVPDGHESEHLVDAFHLVRPKSRAGYRVAPLLEPVRDALLKWREAMPESPHGLVWPNLKGRPANDKHDRAEWWALQETAGVHHPTRLRKDEETGEMVPAFYHVHECRNFAATMLLDAGVPEHVVTDLLGHSSIVQSLKYRTRRREPLMAAMQRVGERLQLG